MRTPLPITYEFRLLMRVEIFSLSVGSNSGSGLRSDHWCCRYRETRIAAHPAIPVAVRDYQFVARRAIFDV